MQLEHLLAEVRTLVFGAGVVNGDLTVLVVTNADGEDLQRVKDLGAELSVKGAHCELYSTLGPHARPYRE